MWLQWITIAKQVLTQQKTAVKKPPIRIIFSSKKQNISDYIESMRIIHNIQHGGEREIDVGRGGHVYMRGI